MEYKAYALMAVLLASVASVGTLGTAYAQTGFTVETDNTEYSTGDTVTISGNVGTVQSGQPVLVWVTSPTGAAARSDQIPAGQIGGNGTYSYSFPAGGPLMSESGTYNVRVTYAGVNQNTTFSFTAEGGMRTATLLIDGEFEHEIQYQITGGTLRNLTGDSETSTVTAGINSTGNGELTLLFPRDVFDSLDQEDSDLDFIVFVDEIESLEVEDDFGQNTRAVTIQFEQGAEQIDIVGTFLVPEFGTIAAIVLAVAIVGTIVATTRYNKFSFLPKM